MIGQTLGQYEIREEAGRGGMAVVYRAYQPTMERDVAIKVIQVSAGHAEEALGRFRREARLIARLEHPHILPVYDYDGEHDPPYIVMRYLDGGTLADLLEEGPLPLDRLTPLLRQVALALDYAHRQGVIHRDVKPSNILIDREGHALVTDFGIGRLVTAGQAGEQLTVAGALVGTPEYIAPEQALGAEEVDRRVDIYGLGVVLFQCLTGELPYEADSLGSLLAQHLQGPIPSAFERNHDLPPAVDGVVARALAKDPGERYQTTMALVDDLALALQSETGIEEAPAPGEPPYKGLAYFDVEDAHLFYGREALTAALVDHLKEGSFLAIVGASGSGKSSVARAGLVAAVQQGEMLSGSETWPVHIITPTARPLETLALSLTRGEAGVTGAKALTRDLAEDPNSLHLYVRRLLEGKNPSRLLLLVDQFEELFTLCKDEGERRAFVDNLVRATAAEVDGPTTVAITLRADFYHHCLQYETLRPALERSQKITGPMNRAELRRMIAGPAVDNGWTLEEGLVERLLQDVGDEPGMLPLLSHALHETWSRRRGRTMTHLGYQEAGGVAGAIAQTAEATYQALEAEEQGIARNIFLRLTGWGEGTQDTRRRAGLSELVPGGQGADEVGRVLARLADARLVITEEETAEVTHEALIREWPRLLEWLDEDREGLRLQRGLSAAAAEWESHGREPSFLYRGQRLAALEDWGRGASVALSEVEGAFLAASREESERQEQARLEGQRKEQQLLAEQRAAGRLRRLALALAVFIVVAVVAAIIAGSNASKASKAQATAEAESEIRATAQVVAENERDRADEEAEAARQAEEEASAAEADALREAERAQQAEEAAVAAQAETERQRRVVLAQSLAAIGPTVLEQSNDSVVATLLALEAANINQEVGGELSWAVELGLQQALGGAFTSTIFGSHDGAVRSAAFSPDGRTLATVGADGLIRLWDLTGGGAPPLVRQGFEIPAGTVSNPGAARIVPVINSVAFAPGGQTLATGGADQAVRLWDGRDPDSPPAVFQGHIAEVNAVAFSPDNRILASGSDDRTIRLWNVDEVEVSPLILEDQASSIRSLAFAPDGLTLASGSADGRIFLWVLAAAGPSFISLEGHEGSVLGLAFTPDGGILASSGGDGAVRLWDMATPGESTLLFQGEEAMWSVAIDGEGESLAAAGGDGLLRLWDLSDPGAAPAVLKGHEEPVYTVAFATDGKTLVSGSRDTTVRLWGAASSLIQPDVVEGGHGRIDGLAFAPDDETLASASDQGGSIHLWDLADLAASPTVLQHEDGRFLEVKFSSDGRYLASAGSAVLLWNAADPFTEPETLLSAYPYADSNSILPIEDIDFSPDDRRLATSYQRVLLWDLALPNHPVDYLGELGFAGDYQKVAYSPDGRRLAATNVHFSSPSLLLWDLESGDVEPAILIDEKMEEAGDIRSMAFTPDGRTLVTGGLRRPVRLWDVTDLGAQPVERLVSADVLSLAISPNGQRLALALEDGTVQVWSLVDDLTSPPIILRGHEGSVQAVAYSPDGLILASGGFDGTIRLWPTLEGLREIGCQQVRRNLTREEWALYLGEEEPYRPTCPDLE